MPGAPDVEAQVRSHARFATIRDALVASSNEGVSGCGGAPVDGGNSTAMPEAELVGPTLRTDEGTSEKLVSETADIDNRGKNQLQTIFFSFFGRAQRARLFRVDFVKNYPYSQYSALFSLSSACAVHKQCT